MKSGIISTTIFAALLGLCLTVDRTTIEQLYPCGQGEFLKVDNYNVRNLKDGAEESRFNYECVDYSIFQYQTPTIERVGDREWCVTGGVWKGEAVSIRCFYGYTKMEWEDEVSKEL